MSNVLRNVRRELSSFLESLPASLAAWQHRTRYQVAIDAPSSWGATLPCERGVVYFARAVGTDLVKIGHTTGDPSQRLAALRTGCPHPMELEAVVPGAADEERAIHGALFARRVRLEWFRLTTDEVSNVCRSVCEGLTLGVCRACGRAGWLGYHTTRELQWLSARGYVVRDLPIRDETVHRCRWCEDGA